MTWTMNIETEAAFQRTTAAPRLPPPRLVHGAGGPRIVFGKPDPIQALDVWAGAMDKLKRQKTAETEPEAKPKGPAPK